MMVWMYGWMMVWLDRKWSGCKGGGVDGSLMVWMDGWMMVWMDG